MHAKRRKPRTTTMRESRWPLLNMPNPGICGVLLQLRRYPRLEPIDHTLDKFGISDMPMSQAMQRRLLACERLQLQYPHQRPQDGLINCAKLPPWRNSVPWQNIPPHIANAVVGDLWRACNVGERGGAFERENCTEYVIHGRK